MLVPDEHGIFTERRLPNGRLLVVIALTVGRARLALGERTTDMFYEHLW